MAEGWADSTPPSDALILPLATTPATDRDYATFYRRELPRLMTLAAAIVGTAAAEEIAQEALLRAHRSWHRISGFDKPGAWARRVTINLATSDRRRRLTEARAIARVSQRRTLDAPPPEVDGFWQLVRQLPPRQAAAVALHYLEDLTVAEIAETLGCAEGTAKAHLHKARRTLADRLTEEPEP
ncbi:MAG: RNA polymerase sigma factor [Acidimicrobiales bacterium]